MTDFLDNSLAVARLALSRPNKLHNQSRDELLAYLEEHFTETQLAELEAQFSDLADFAYTARRRAKAGRKQRERVAAMTDEEILAENPTRSLAGALSLGRTLHSVGGGEAA